MSSVQQNNNRNSDNDNGDQKPLHVLAEQCNKFAPSQAFTKETLEDIRKRLGFKVSSMTFKQFVSILDILMTVCFNLSCVATDTGVFRYVTWAHDDVLAESICQGETYVLKLDEFAPSVKREIIDHIGYDFALDPRLPFHEPHWRSQYVFSRYQKKLEELCEGPDWWIDFELYPIDQWEGNLPTRKQVLDLYHEKYGQTDSE